jgi:hypothetical protein
MKNAKSVACNLALAKYWGTCGETILNAVDILKKDPTATVESALKSGFAKSALRLLPPPSSKKRVFACA